ncbi:hypothetical protein HYT24_03100 [Candidatus Pacearchaeota archaeon]|nr:hypothetical protein [Candidatus Pacearchaeota archaeon]
MDKVILDTNFIMTCVKQKIDLFWDMKAMGMQIIVPKQVINELNRVIKSKQKYHFREDAEVSLKILENEKNNYQKIDLKKYGKNTDSGIRNFANAHKDVLVATMDQRLKRSIRNNKVVIRGRKRLQIVQ